jgi:hypothetical protein
VALRPFAPCHCPRRANHHARHNASSRPPATTHHHFIFHCPLPLELWAKTHESRSLSSRRALALLYYVYTIHSCMHWQNPFKIDIGDESFTSCNIRSEESGLVKYLVRAAEMCHENCRDNCRHQNSPIWMPRCGGMYASSSYTLMSFSVGTIHLLLK